MQTDVVVADDWTGPASATLIGVGCPARDAAAGITASLR